MFFFLSICVITRQRPERMTQVVHSLEEQFEAAGGGYFSVDEACLLPVQRDEIWHATRVSAAVRQRGGWHCRQLTLSADESDLRVDLAMAKRLSFDAISENYDAGIRRIADVPANHRQNQRRDEDHDEDDLAAEASAAVPSRRQQRPQQQQQQHRSASASQDALVQALQVAHANQMSCEGLKLQCNSTQYNTVRYNTMSN